MAGTAFADDVADCNQQQDLDLRISGCTALTKQPQTAGAATRRLSLQLRGNAYREKRSSERALTDYIEAMALASDER